jgi:hypothetical protein
MLKRRSGRKVCNFSNFYRIGFTQDLILLLHNNFVYFLFDLDKDSKKRHRNLQKLGIGGFLVRLRAPRYKDEDHDGSDLSTLDGDKPKRKPQRRKMKNKLVETFPIYLQVIFSANF